MVNEGVEDSFSVYTQDDIYYPMTDAEYDQLEKRIYIENVIDAPVVKGQQVGYIDIWIGTNKICAVNLTAPSSIGENSYEFNLGRIIRDWIQNRILDM